MTRPVSVCMTKSVKELYESVVPNAADATNQLAIAAQGALVLSTRVGPQAAQEARDWAYQILGLCKGVATVLESDIVNPGLVELGKEYLDEISGGTFWDQFKSGSHSGHTPDQNGPNDTTE